MLHPSPRPRLRSSVRCIRNLRAPSLAAGLAALLALTAPAQGQAPGEDAGGGGKKASSTSANKPSFPVTLLPVGEPGKKLSIELGLGYKEAADLAEDIHPDSKAKRDLFLATLRYELGEKTFEFDPFFLAKHPVTNAEYKAFVEDTGYRYPFHWWRYGREDDFLSEERTEALRTAESPYVYWEKNWQELPWKIPEGSEDLPVVYVRWRDAAAYAAWAGCRLPTEAEWTFAMTGGDRDRNYIWGAEWDPAKLPKQALSDYGLQPVGKYAQAIQGPFGHTDVGIYVWEWTSDIARPFTESTTEWRDQLDRLQRQKVAEDVEFLTPEFGPHKKIIKGGSYHAKQDARQMRLYTRYLVGPLSYQDAIGFRLAKSYRPARDHAEGALNLDYVWNFFGGDRHPNLADHVGVERYELAENGRTIENYYALSIVPVSHYGEKDKPRLREFRQQTQKQPAVVGTIANSMPLQEPELAAGYYTLMYRTGGKPDELSDALEEAQRDLRKIKAAEERGRDVPKPDRPPTWRGVLRRYGIEEAEALEHGASLDYIRMNPGGLKIPVKPSLFLVRDRDGLYTSWFEADDKPDYERGYDEGDSTVSIESREANNKHAAGEVLTFEFGVPQYQDSRGKVIRFEVPLVISEELAGGSAWRTPEPAR